MRGENINEVIEKIRNYFKKLVRDSGYNINVDNRKSNQMIDDLRNIVCDELILNALDYNDEPTQYGLELEQLIDELGHYIDE